MVDPVRREPIPRALRQEPKDVQERHGIRPARASDDDRAAALDERVVADRPLGVPTERRRVRPVSAHASSKALQKTTISRRSRSSSRWSSLG